MTSKPRNAFITGAGKNIGRAVALELARRGYKLVINGRADRAACEDVAKEAQAKSVRAVVAMGDVGIATEAQRLAADALKQLRVRRQCRDPSRQAVSRNDA